MSVVCSCCIDVMKPNFPVVWSSSENSCQAWLEISFDKAIGKEMSVLKFLFNGLDLFFMCEVLLFVV